MSIILWKHFLLHNYQTYLSNEGRVPDEVTCYNVLDVLDIIKDNENNNYVNFYKKSKGNN